MDDLPHSLLDALGLEISKLTSIGDMFETCMLEKKAWKIEWIREVEAMRFLNTGLHVVDCEFIKNVVEARADQDLEIIFMHG